jgi:hypothetical protein
MNDSSSHIWTTEQNLNEMKILLLIPILFMVGCASPYKYTKMYQKHKHHIYKYKSWGCAYCDKAT